MGKSPTSEGLRMVWRTPSLWMAEVAWRWCFGAGSLLLGALSATEFLRSLKFSAADMLFLRSKNPMLVSMAVTNVLEGSGARLLRVAAVLLPGMAILWTFAAALGRTATLKVILQESAEGGGEPGRVSRFRGVLGTSFLRAAAALAAVVGFFGAAIIAGRVAGGNPGAAIAVFLCAGVVVALTWSAVNWVLSLAAIFPARDGSDSMTAVAQAVELFRRHPGRFFATSTWFGLMHSGIFLIASFVAVFPAAALGKATTAAILALAVITLLYFACVDALYIARLAAYVAIAEDDRRAGIAVEPESVPETPMPAIPAGIEQ
jgi:hypothetical protein